MLNALTGLLVAPLVAHPKTVPNNRHPKNGKANYGNGVNGVVILIILIIGRRGLAA